MLVYLLVQDGGGATWTQVVVSLFFTGGIVQLLATTIFLWMFGITVEDSMARWRFLALYLLGGLAALGLHALLEPGAVPTSAGATGAVAALIGGHLALYPRARLVTAVWLVIFFALYEVPTWLLLGVWVVVQAVLALAGVGGAGDGIAAFAWVGGLAFGLVAIRAFAQRRKAPVAVVGASTAAVRP